MRETNKFLRRKLANKKKPNFQMEKEGRKKIIEKQPKYYKQEIENSIEEYYRKQ